MSAISVESPEAFRKMPQEYQDLALRQFRVHTEGELSGADDYIQVFLPIAPNAYERKVCCERAAEELDHYIIGSRVLAELGVDTTEMLEQELMERSLYASPAIHRIKRWPQRALFSFLGEDAVLDHIKEMTRSSYKPWAESFPTVVRDEHVHIGHGRRIVRELMGTDAGAAEIQATLTRMWPLILSLFGSDGSKHAEAYLHWGLRQKTNKQAREDFVARVTPELERMGLTVPDVAELPVKTPVAVGATPVDSTVA